MFQQCIDEIGVESYTLGINGVVVIYFRDVLQRQHVEAYKLNHVTVQSFLTSTYACLSIIDYLELESLGYSH
jgi:hypothetical protein